MAIYEVHVMEFYMEDYYPHAGRALAFFSSRERAEEYVAAYRARRQALWDEGRFRPSQADYDIEVVCLLPDDHLVDPDGSLEWEETSDEEGCVDMLPVARLR